ncbi:MAG TPA: SOS-induced cell division inhibitor SulA [Arsenophonus sp.]
MNINTWNYPLKTENQHNNVQKLLVTNNNSPAYLNGIVNEWIYNEKNPMVEILLTSLLHRLSDESRWLLWLNPNRKLSRNWLINSELPLNKIIQINSLSPEMSVIAMKKALASGNCSIVLGWLPPLSESCIQHLEQAAQLGNTIGFLMRPENTNCYRVHSNQLKIHSNYYH